MSDYIRKEVIPYQGFQVAPRPIEECCSCAQEGAAPVKRAAKPGPPRRAALKGRWSFPGLKWLPAEIIGEARRCIYCAKPSCAAHVRSGVNPKEFIHAVGEGNYYYAGKVILSANPFGLSSARMSGPKTTGESSCVLNGSAVGPIHIPEIMAFAMERFREYGLVPTHDPTFPPRKERVAIIGAGVTGLTAADFLARLGFQVEVFEESPVAGGILGTTVPEFRLPKEDLEWEIHNIEQMGVKIHLGVKIAQKEGEEANVMTLGKLGKQFDFVYVSTELFATTEYSERFDMDPTLWGTHVGCAYEFMRNCKSGEKAELDGKVIIIVGAGESALDAARAAYRCGAKLVSVVAPVEFEKFGSVYWKKVAQDEGVVICPNIRPILANEEGLKVRPVSFDDEEVSSERDYMMPADMVLIAGGYGQPPVVTMPKEPFEVLGDKVLLCPKCAINGSLGTCINSGKLAAMEIYNKLAPEHKIDSLPLFHTDVDEVSLETHVGPIKMVNPFGISSAPVSGTAECIRGCFECGFGFAVTKTFCLDKDVEMESDLRIVKCLNDTGYSGVGCSAEGGCTSYNNQCLITERKLDYWIKTIIALKKLYPDRVIIASIMAPDNKDSWQHLAREAEKAGADGLELNLSCPNECHGEGGSGDVMAMALGVIPAAVERITKYVTDVTKLPVFTKLTPNVTNIEDIAVAATRGGGHISLINTVVGVSKVFPNGTAMPQVGKEQYALSGGLSGDQIRPIALRHIMKAVNAVPPGTLVLGIGGVRSALTAMEFLLSGAHAVQMCSVCQRYGYEIIREIIAGTKFLLYSWSVPHLRKMLNSYGELGMLPRAGKVPEGPAEKVAQDGVVPSVNDIVGLAAPKMVQRGNFEKNWTITARIDRTRCIDCGACMVACRDNSIQAIQLTPAGKVVVNPGRCVGCGLCMTVCPRDCIAYVEPPKKRVEHFHPMNQWLEDAAKQ